MINAKRYNILTCRHCGQIVVGEPHTVADELFKHMLRDHPAQALRYPDALALIGRLLRAAWRRVRA